MTHFASQLGDCGRAGDRVVTGTARCGNKRPQVAEPGHYFQSLRRCPLDQTSPSQGDGGEIKPFTDCRLETVSRYRA